MKRLIPIVTIIGLTLSLSGEIRAASASVTARSGGAAVGVAPKIAISRNWVFAQSPTARFPRYLHPHYYPYSYWHHGYYRQPIIIVTPYYYVPYYAPARLITSEPFFCFLHNVGYVSRAGMLDHLSGTHKISLETAVSACPEGIESCVVEGY